MSEQLGQAVLDLTVDDSKLTKGLGAAERTSKKSASTMQSSFDKAGRGMEDSLTGVGREGERSARKVSDAYDEAAADAKSSLGGISDAAKRAGAVLGGAFVAGQAISSLDDAAISAGRLEARLGISADAAKDFDAVAKQVYRDNFGETMTQAADSVALVHQALGLTDDRLLKTTETILSLGDAFEDQGADVQLLTEDLRTMRQAFPGKSENELLDQITHAFQQGAGTAGDLQDTLQEYPTFFRDIGLTSKDMLSFLSLGMREGARNTDTLGDSIKEFGIRVQTTGDTGQIALRKMFPKSEADRLIKAFSEGGRAGRDAFFTVMRQLDDTEDSQKRYNLRVALFGTMAEDNARALDKLTPAFVRSKNATDQSRGATEHLEAQYTGFAATLESVKRSIETGFVGAVGDAAGEVLELGSQVGITALGIGALVGPAKSAATALGILTTAETAASTTFLRGGFGKLLAGGIGAAGLANTVSSALSGDMEDAGAKAGGELAGGVIGGLAGGLPGALVGSGVGSLVGGLINDIFGDQEEHVERRVKSLVREAARTAKAQDEVASSYQRSSKRLREAREREGDATNRLHRLEARRKKLLDSYPASAGPVARLDRKIAEAREDQNRATRKANRLEREHGALKDALKGAMVREVRANAELIRSYKDRVHQLHRQLEGMSKSERRSAAGEEVAKKLERAEGNLTKALGKQNDKLDEAATRIGPHFANSLARTSDALSKSGRAADRANAGIAKLMGVNKEAIDTFGQRSPAALRRLIRALENLASGSKETEGAFKDATQKSGVHIQDLDKVGYDGLRNLLMNLGKALRSVDMEPPKGFALTPPKGGEKRRQTGGTLAGVVPGAPAGDTHLLSIDGVPQAKVEGTEGIFVGNARMMAVLDHLNGQFPRFAGGGVIEQALGPYTIPPIMYDPHHAGGNAHLHLDFFTKDQTITYGKKMQGMGWSIGEYSGPYGGFGPVTVQHQSPGHYDGTAFDANKGVVESRPDVAAVARLLGGVGGVGGALAEKLARVLIDGPDGPLRSVGQGILDTTWRAFNKEIEKHSGNFRGERGVGGIPSVSGDFGKVWDEVNPDLAKWKRLMGEIVQVESSGDPHAGGPGTSNPGHAGWYQYDSPTWAGDRPKGAPGWPEGPYDPASASAGAGNAIRNDGMAGVIQRWTTWDGVTPQLLLGGLLRLAGGGSFNPLMSPLAQSAVLGPLLTSPLAQAFINPHTVSGGGQPGGSPAPSGEGGGFLNLAKLAAQLAGANDAKTRRGLLAGAKDKILARTAIDNLSREGDLGGTLKDLRDAADIATDNADFASSLAQTDADGNVIAGSDVFSGLNQAGWLGEALTQLWDLRNALVRTDSKVVANMHAVRDLIEEVKGPKGILADLAERIRELQRKLKELETKRDNLQDALEAELDKPEKKRDKARIKSLRERLEANKGERNQVTDRIARLSAAREGMKGLVTSGGVLSTRLADLHSGEETILDHLSTVQGSGVTLEDWTGKALPDLGTFKGEIGQLQVTLRDLGAEQPSPVANAFEGLDIEGLRSFSEAMSLGAFANVPFAGFFRAGGFIPGGAFGIAGEAGAELVHGPARVYSNEDSAAMFSPTIYADFSVGGEVIERRIEGKIKQIDRASSERFLAGVRG